MLDEMHGTDLFGQLEAFSKHRQLTGPYHLERICVFVFMMAAKATAKTEALPVSVQFTCQGM